MRLSLPEAAAFLGMTTDALHIMSWAKQGPPSANGAYWEPQFEKTELEVWKRDNAPRLPLREPRRLGVKAVYRHRRV